MLMRRLRHKEKIMAQNGTVAYVRELPDCDIHNLVDGVPNIPALYDLKTRDGRWANVCADHRVTHAMYQELGIGKGQKLEVKLS